jgi:O-acetyl-ADP-ribose deacetylase (regulator of RNase III)
MQIEIIYGNIVKQPDADAIVNSANANLRMGSGVAGAIHTAAGPKLEEYCRPFAPLALGAGLITPGFKLPNLWVIHVRSAHYVTNDEPEKYMQMALETMLRIANDNDLRTLAVPAIGTGMFKFPPALAARLTAQVLAKADALAPHLNWVRICLADQALVPLYESAFAQAGLQCKTPELHLAVCIGLCELSCWNVQASLLNKIAL